MEGRIWRRLKYGGTKKKINILQGYYIPTKMSTRYFKYVGKEYSEWLSDREPEVGKGYPKNVRA